MSERIYCVCGHHSEKRKWNYINFSSGTGSGAIIGNVYNDENERHNSCGSIDLYACPECGTVKFIPRK